MVRRRQSRRASRRNQVVTTLGLPLVLLIFLTLSIWHSLIVPITQGEDELAHFRYISFIAESGRLPVNTAEREQAWYRADWPPLYHLLVGWVVSPLDTTQPHLKDVGESPRRRLVGQIFYPRLIIYTEDADRPWQGAILAWHIGRFISIALAALALLFTYQTAFEFAEAARGGRGAEEQRSRGAEEQANKADPSADPPVLQSPTPPPLHPSNLPPLHPSTPPTFQPSPELFALVVTAVLAFTPRFIFTSAMLSDDSLFILLSAIFIWLLLRTLRGDDRWWIYAVLGLLLGLSITTKYSTVLLPLAIIPLVWWRARQAGWTWVQSVRRVLVAWGSVLLGAGWWFGWIIYHFNTIRQDGWLNGLLSPMLASGPDVSMRRIFDFLGGGDFTGSLRPEAVGEGSFGEWWVYLFQTFWGVPILEVDPLFPWVYLVVLIVVLLAVVGLWRYWPGADAPTRVSVGVLVLIVALLFPFPILRFFLTYNILETGQGRHILFPAAQAIPILLMLGLIAVLRRPSIPAAGTQQPKMHDSQSAILIVPVLLLLWASFQLRTMVNTYPKPLPVQTTTFDPAVIPQPLKRDFDIGLRLLGYDFQADPDRAIINLTLFWQALKQVDENYRTQVQLIDQTGEPRFTWISHPLNGLYPTRAWDEGDVVRDTLPLPLAAVPAAKYDIELALLPEAGAAPLTEPFQFIQFDLAQEQPIVDASTLPNGAHYRLWLDHQPLRQRQTIPLSWAGLDDASNDASLDVPDWGLIDPQGAHHAPVAVEEATAIFIVDPAWPSGDYRLGLSNEAVATAPPLTVAVEARQFDLPPDLAADPAWTPVEANFADKIKLLGYSLPARRLEPGGGLPLTVAWQSLAPVLPDALTFAVLLDANQQPHGSVDRYPAGYYSPLLWANGEVVPDSFTVPIDPTAPPGVYQLHLGLYQVEDGQPQSLPLHQDGQPTETTAVVIGSFKIGGPPPQVVTTNPSPQVMINQDFGGQITLLGYDLEIKPANEELGQSSTAPNSETPNPPTLQPSNPPPSSFQPSNLPTLHLTLFWRAETPPPTDYTTFLHLRNAANQNAAQKDSPPAAGRYPTSLWEPGEIIVDDVVLPLDQVEPGAYTPVVGLYELATGDRLLTPGNPANEAALQPVTMK